MDLVFLGGNVLTMDKADHRAEAVAVDKGKIVAVGANAEIKQLTDPGTRIVEMRGRTLLPGFIDAHNHFAMTTLSPVSVDCRTPPLTSVSGALQAIASAVKGLPKGKWLMGWGFSSRMLGRGITRGELDEIAPDNPVCIVDGSYHACFVNSEALRLAGTGKDVEDPRTGWYRRDERGGLSGALWERAMDPIHTLCFKAYQDYYGEGMADLVHHNAMMHIALGITGVSDACVTGCAAEMYRQADKKGKLPILLHQMRGGDTFLATPDGICHGDVSNEDVSDRLRGGTAKLFMDPALPMPALIRYHADGTTERFGEIYYTQEEADDLVLAAHRKDLQVAIHCLGPWSIEQALNAFENAQKKHHRPDPRFRIEHISFPHPSQIQRAAALGVIACVQPPMVYGAGPDREQRARDCGGGVRPFPFRSLKEAGVTVAASSDAPCYRLEPLLGLWAMVTRRTKMDGYRLVPDEAVSPLEGLRMYTINAAYAMMRDHEVGSIEKGKRADLVVLSHDPTAVDPYFIRDIEVERTYIDGQLLYEYSRPGG